MLKIKNKATNLIKKMYTGGILAITSIVLWQPVYAQTVGDSKLVKGTERLFTDVTTWLMILAPIVAGLMIIYFCIRRAAADEMDTKKWNNRIVVAIISCVGAIIGSATLNIIIGYYK